MSSPHRPARKSRRSPRPARRPARRALQHETLEQRFVAAGDVFTPIVGDWNGDGHDTLGLFNNSTSQFYLRDLNAPGFPHRLVTPAIAPAGSVPIAGDWNGDGRDSPGLFDAANARFLLLDDNGQLFSQVSVTAAQASGAKPAAGDFNGDGRDDVALFSPATRNVTMFYANAPHVATLSDLPATGNFDVLAGNFDGDARDEVALLNRATQRVHIVGFATRNSQLIDNATTSLVLAGDWGGHGSATLGWFEQSTGLFTPWQVWSDDPLASAIYSVPSTNVQSHVDLPLLKPWSNSRGSVDVDDDGIVTAVDAVLVLNSLNALGPRALPDFRPASAAHTGFIDPSGDGMLAPLDVLLVINHLNAVGSGRSPNGEPHAPMAMFPELSAAEVTTLLDRASAASSSTDAIVAIVDRGGRILGVRVEQSVLNTFVGNTPGLVFAIDGAVAKARTAAFFSSNQAPLTSRTVRFISQSTVTQREVQSNPNVGSFASTFQGPGFVAPIGLGGHFPPGVTNTPPVDLFAIEHTNRDSIVHPGQDGLKGTADDQLLASRFNVPAGFIPAGQGIEAPESYGFTSMQYVQAQSRGIATLPGGEPLFRNGTLIGGIGVFFPGSDGTATFEQGFVAGVGQTELQRTNAPKVLEAEWIAFAAAGGVITTEFPFARIDTINGIPLPAGIRLPFGRIDLVGITLEIYGPNPTAANPTQGVNQLLQVGAFVGVGPVSGAIPDVTPGVPTRDGVTVPQGWLVLPHTTPGSALSQADVERMIMQGIAEANLVRAAIRLPIGQRTKMVFSVSDLDGNVLGLYRMPDATVFSIDVAVAKARNEAYYADPATIVPADRVDDDRNGVPDLPVGVALTARTFRFLAEPRYPAGIDFTLSGAFSILRDPGINWLTAENVGPALPASVYTSTLGFDAFHVGRNFRDPGNGSVPATRFNNQNGVVFFPGSTPLYVGGTIAGGLGVSGDGVDQDDVVTWSASVGYQTPTLLRADQYFVRDVRLPFQKFLRNPHG
jgi:uncharacterized protein GlcG (DUF336 family)